MPAGATGSSPWQRPPGPSSLLKHAAFCSRGSTASRCHGIQPLAAPSRSQQPSETRCILLKGLYCQQVPWKPAPGSALPSPAAGRAAAAAEVAAHWVEEQAQTHCARWCLQGPGGYSIQQPSLCMPHCSRSPAVREAAALHCSLPQGSRSKPSLKSVWSPAGPWGASPLRRSPFPSSQRASCSIALVHENEENA